MKTNSPLNDASRAYFSNVLNEVLHGFRVDYEMTLGVRREDVLHLFKELNGPRDGQREIESMSPAEVQLLLKCSNLCLQEFDADEFETRTGEAPAAAKDVNQFLSSSTELAHLRA